MHPMNRDCHYISMGTRVHSRVIVYEDNIRIILITVSHIII